MPQFDGMTAVVTGGAGGIGEACAEGLAQGGASVILIDRSEDANSAAARRLADRGCQVNWITLDVTDRDSVEAAFESIGKAGGVDILVTSAAIVKTAPVIDFDIVDWERILSVNLTGTFNCCQFAARQMVEKGYGRIVTISSVNGQIANTGRGAYSCTKAGVDALTRLLAAELGDRGITANAVAPTPVDTEMILQVHGPDDRALWHAQIPAKRYAQPHEVAAAVCFLASTEASYINGHILNVDGGFMASGILRR